LIVTASALKRSKASMAYCSAVLPMSPRLASRITGSCRMAAVDMGDQCFELIFGAASGKIGDLRLEAADEVCRRVDNGPAELEDAVRLALEVDRQARRVGIEADAEQAVALAARPRFSACMKFMA
jgi:hypothetical protein